RQNFWHFYRFSRRSTSDGCRFINADGGLAARQRPGGGTVSSRRRDAHARRHEGPDGVPGLARSARTGPAHDPAAAGAERGGAVVDLDARETRGRTAQDRSAPREPGTAGGGRAPEERAPQRARSPHPRLSDRLSIPK